MFNLRSILMTLLLVSVSAAQVPPSILERSAVTPQPNTNHALVPLNSGQDEKKSGALAVVYSLLLPGMGELYTERFDQGQYSLIAEGSLWLAYGSFIQYGGWKRDDARVFAQNHAGVTMEGKDDQFFINVGNFNNVYEYNEKKLQDRNDGKVYDPSAGYLWRWDEELNRLRYRDQRLSSDRIFSNSGFVLGAIVVNHLVSAFNAARLVRQHNAAINDADAGLNIGSSLLRSDGQINGVMVHFSVGF
jgi:hypothetical protein